MATNGGLSSLRSGIKRVHIVSLNSPSAVIKNLIFEKLYTRFLTVKTHPNFSDAVVLKQNQV